MKENIINFIKDFEKGLAKDFNNSWEDIGYYNYCLGMKDTCLKAKSIINNNSNIIETLKKEQSEINKNDYVGIERQYYVGAYNMYNYIINEIEKEV
jgi:hypothetical protein